MSNINEELKGLNLFNNYRNNVMLFDENIKLCDKLEVEILVSND